MTISNAEIIGNAYSTLKKVVKEYAMNDLPVLFSGDSGTGKELLANLYMASSGRKGKKMTINCASYPDALLRSEIFGHAKGAFTDAKEKRDGKIKACAEGVLFLDELGDASKEFQAAILRVADGYGYYPVGSDDEIKIDVKIIAATLKPEEVRIDLKERFHILPVPPLQKTDIPLIAKHFLGKRSLKPDILADLQSRPYPGNVRGLKKYCERLKTEKGEPIFLKDAAKPTPQKDNDFDYERYRREIETWQKYIQPLINKFKITTFRHEYMAWDSEIMKEPLWEHYSDSIGAVRLLTHGFKQGALPLSKEAEAKTAKTYSIGMIELIDMLQNDVSDELKKIFVSHLKKYFVDKTLPYLLETLQTNEKPIKSETIKMFPPLSSLLNIQFDEAMREFRKRYAEYNLDRYKSDQSGLENATGKTKKDLRQTIRRSEPPKTE